MASTVSDTNYRYVPWYSMEEFKLVYAQIYSNDFVEVQKAFRRLLIWKAKKEHLPAGIDCTLEVLQVRLRERELQSVLSEKDLQPMYSMAIQRFINMITSLQQETKAGTIYLKAQNMKIPSWIVSLRHDAAHSTIGPPLHALKLAADYILNWLNDYYWKIEAENTFDNYIQEMPSDNPSFKKEMLTIELLISSYSGLVSENGHSISEDKIAHLTKLIPKTEKLLEIKNKLHLREAILSRLAKIVIKQNNNNHILNFLVEETNFLYLPDDTSRYIKHRNKWSEVLIIFHKNEILLDLLKILLYKLEENTNLSNKAATWMDEILKAFIKLGKCLKLKLSLIKENKLDNYTEKEKFLIIKKLAEKEYSKLNQVFVLKGRMPRIEEFKEILEHALRNPCDHTLVFLDILCLLSGVSKLVVLELVNIYMNSDNVQYNNGPLPQGQIYTVESILNDDYEMIVDSKSKQCDVTMIGNEELDGDEDNWKLAQGIDWLHCPLGAIPSQAEIPYLDIDLLNQA